MRTRHARSSCRATSRVARGLGFDIGSRWLTYLYIQKLKSHTVLRFIDLDLWWWWYASIKSRKSSQLWWVRPSARHTANTQTSSSTVSLNSRSTFCPCSSVVDSPWRLRRAPRSNFGAFNSLTLRIWTCD